MVLNKCIITGGNVFVSCLVFVFCYFAILMTVSADMPLVGCVLTLLLLVLLIFMAAKGLRYQALMTSLNGVRFSFNCSYERVLVGNLFLADFNGHWDGDCFLYLDKDATCQ